MASVLRLGYSWWSSKRKRDFGVVEVELGLGVLRSLRGRVLRFLAGKGSDMVGDAVVLDAEDGCAGVVGHDVDSWGVDDLHGSGSSSSVGGCCLVAGEIGSSGWLGLALPGLMIVTGQTVICTPGIVP